MALALERTRWLFRRLSRIYPAEIPYRVLTILRVFAQSRGFFDGRKVPGRAPHVRFGKPWAVEPCELADSQLALAAARRLLAGDFEVLGTTVPTVSGVPDWNRDPVTGRSMPLGFGLLFDPRHVADDIDIKYLWEVNRHLWWVTLAQGYALTGERAYAERLAALIDSWIEACPFPRGPNWTSPVEHGIRLINWSLVWHLLGGEGAPIFEGEAGAARRDRWLDCIYRHVRFARDNYSFHSSADNHLIGEAAGIFIAAQTWDLWDDVRRMGVEAKALLERETLRQFAPDGVNREQAFCYHKFALQFLVAAGLCGRANGEEFSSAYWQRIESGLVFLAAVMDCAGRVPAVGDGDDSDVFRLGHEPGAAGYQALLALGARLFPESVVGAKCVVLGLGPARPGQAAAEPLGAIPAAFAEGGYLLLGHRLHAADEIRVLFDVGPLGYNRVAGHGHADALSLAVSCGGRDVVVDPGTYCYNSTPALRRHFRGTAAHNTVVVDGRDQADYGSSFLWLTDVASTLLEHREDDVLVLAEAAHDGYRRLPDPVTHRRRVVLDRAQRTLEVEDWIECGAEHDLQWHWHFAPDIDLQPGADGQWHFSAPDLGGSVEMSGPGLELAVVRGSAQPPQGWVSPRFGVLQAAPVLIAKARLGAGRRVRTLFRLDR